MTKPEPPPPDINIDLRAPGGGEGNPPKQAIERRRMRGEGTALVDDREWKKPDQKP